jgi:ribosome biogenesis GTPase / thiamine phosphate phosphatase
VLDTPGMRELQLWDAGGGIETAFEDVEALAVECRFSDCRHEREPGCAVLAAVDSGGLQLDRLRSWRKLQRELHALELKQSQRLRIEARRARRVQARSFRKPSW